MKILRKCIEYSLKYHGYYDDLFVWGSSTGLKRIVPTATMSHCEFEQQYNPFVGVFEGDVHSGLASTFTFFTVKDRKNRDASFKYKQDPMISLAGDPFWGQPKKGSRRPRITTATEVLKKPKKIDWIAVV